MTFVQAYDAKTLELKNPMRFRDNIAIARTGTDTYRVTGGQNRKGDVGDVAVWSIRETMRPSRRGAVTAGSCAGCTFENVTVYATPHGCGYAESSADGNRYLGCSLVRRPPETDLFPRALKRLRSGNAINLLAHPTARAIDLVNVEDVETNFARPQRATGSSTSF